MVNSGFEQRGQVFSADVVWLLLKDSRWRGGQRRTVPEIELTLQRPENDGP
jgi:hypothetical protein